VDYQKVTVPQGEKITKGADGKLNVPNNPIVPFIEGDRTRADIWRASVRVIDSAGENSYRGTRKISWTEIYAGRKANVVYGPNTWLPQETLEVVKDFLIVIKGPLINPCRRRDTEHQRGVKAGT